MDDPASRPDLLAWPTGALVGGLAVCVLVWLGLHAISRKSIISRILLPVLSGIIASGGFWFLFQLTGKFLHFSTPWPLTGFAAAGGIALETVHLAYAHERQIIKRPAGRTLFLLRLLALLLILGVLLEPVMVTESTRQIRRNVAVFIDTSKSMHLIDRNHNATELLDLSALAGNDVEERERSLAGAMHVCNALAKTLDAMRGELEPPSASSPAKGRNLDAAEVESAQRRIREAEATRSDLAGLMSRLGKNTQAPELQESSDWISNAHDQIAKSIAGDLKGASHELDIRQPAKAARSLEAAVRRLRDLTVDAPIHIELLDEYRISSMNETEMSKVLAAARRPRLDLVREALGGDGGSLLEELADEYNLRIFHFHEDTSEVPSSDPLPRNPSSGDRSDIARALDTAISQFDSDDLGGVIVVSDGRHTAESSVGDAARRLALEGIPVNTIAMGSRRGPRDAAITDVRAPESVFQDDVAEILADVAVTGMAGETIAVFLYVDGTPADKRDIVIDKDDYRETLTFSHKPESLGVADYEIKLHGVTEETFESNNASSFAIAASDDRTNVLLLDGYPRWEFRYLRNLFFARDKSVHLQHVLFRPDRIAGAIPPDPIPASASRPFAEAEANALPASREEWLKFDAIIIGDVPQEALDEESWESIRAAVAERGSLLVLIAGPRSMPQAFDSETVSDLLPVILNPFFSDAFNPPEPSYRFRLTAGGAGHPLLRLAADPDLNERIWSGLPLLHWRSPAGEIKAAAEVLAYAEPAGGADLSSDPEGQRANALIVAHRFALGRVVLLNFDRTWRLRYGIGDVLHHRFWGNILRWGGAENLRSGSEFVRLGTNRLRYQAGEPVLITSRFKISDSPPVVRATIAHSGNPVAATILRPRPESPWLFDGMAGGLETPGEYTVTITSPEGSVTTEFRIIEKVDDAEMRDVTVNYPLLERIASTTGGVAVGPRRARDVLASLKSPIKPIVERRERPVWDNGIVLGLFALLLTAEWILRRKSGLA